MFETDYILSANLKDSCSVEKSTIKLLDRNSSYSESKTIREILIDLLSLKKMDSAVETSRNPYLVPLIFSIIFGGVAVFGILLAAEGVVINGTMVLVVIIISISLISYFYYKYGVIEKLNIENERYECGISLLELLSEDIYSKEKVNLKIQFGSIEKPKFLVKSAKINKNFIVEERYYSAN